VTKKHILVIEDESSIADNITYALTSEGFTCSWAGIGSEGLDLLAAKNIDRTVDTHIKTIRAKLRVIAPQNSLLTTHRGVGYSIKLK
jgi:DNA-binding response OmpR family regulator